MNRGRWITCNSTGYATDTLTIQTREDSDLLLFKVVDGGTLAKVQVRREDLLAMLRELGVLELEDKNE